jgi:hypothetical protein
MPPISSYPSIISLCNEVLHSAYSDSPHAEQSQSYPQSSVWTSVRWVLLSVLRIQIYLCFNCHHEKCVGLVDSRSLWHHLSLFPCDDWDLVYLVFDDVDSCIPSPGHRTVLYARVNFLYSNPCACQLGWRNSRSPLLKRSTQEMPSASFIPLWPSRRLLLSCWLRYGTVTPVGRKRLGQWHERPSF